MNRIVCVGSGLVAGDTAGPAVFERLASAALPPGVELVDGGLGGLDLLRFVEGTGVAVFVDSVSGFGPAGTVRVLRPEEVVSLGSRPFDHGSGLTYLLGVLPRVLEPPLPSVHVVGVEEPWGEASIDEAARLALSLASAGEDRASTSPQEDHLAAQAC